MNQRQATVNAMLSVLKDRGVEYEVNGDTPISEVLTPDDKSKVREILFTMFREGKITYKPEFQAKVDDDKELKSYVGGLLNNWIRKAKELNCGEVYKAKNPGSRAGSGDEQVREMKKLLQVTADADAKAAIQAAIDARLAEIKAEKNTVEVNLDAIPEALRAQLGL